MEVPGGDIEAEGVDRDFYDLLDSTTAVFFP